MSERNTRIDSLKYWLIVLVIIGHVFERCSSSDASCAVLYKWIYIFHMPLFIFISGYFSHKKGVKNFWKGLWKILEPFIVFQSIICIGEFINSGTLSFTRLFTPWYALWYLLSLFYWRLILQVIPDRILNKPSLIIFLTLGISTIAGFFPFDRFLSIQRTLAFMPFFFMGYYMKDKSLFLPSKFKPLFLLFIVATIFVPLFCSSYLGDLYRANMYDGIDDMFKRLFTFILSIPISIAFINICPDFSWSAKQGKYTMQYYIYHSFMVTIMMLIINHLEFPKSFIFAVLYVALIVVSLGIGSYVPLFSKITYPISSLFIKSKRNNNV